MAERHSAAIAIASRQGAEPFDVSLLSQSLPCKPRSLARTSPELEPPPLELPKSSPAHDPIIDGERGRTLIRYNTEITAEEFSSSPAEREVYLSQSCPNWGTFQMPEARIDFGLQPKEETAPGAVAVPGHGVVEQSAEAEAIGKSPTILESFKMYNATGMDEKVGESLDDITEEGLNEIAPEEEEEDDAQFSLEA